MSKKAEYPECEKLAAVGDEVRLVCNFVEWLSGEKEVFLESDSMLPSVTSLVHEFFEIDEKKLEAERQAMLASIRW